MREFLSNNLILLTIILSLVSSALWDFGLRPVVIKSGGLLLNLITFGIRRLQDRIYRLAAAKQKELPSTITMLYGFFIIFGTVIHSGYNLYSSVYFPTLSPKSLILGTNFEDKFRTDVESCMSNVKNLTKNNFDIKFTECKNTAVKEIMMESSMHFGYFFILFSLVFLFVLILRVSYSTFVISYFEQCLNATKPFLTEKDSLIFEQRFALMSTKNEFDRIIEDLNSVAEKFNISLPDKQ